MLTTATLAVVGTPCIVLNAMQPKLGIRLPCDLPIVVDATRMNAAESHDILLRWLYMFVTLARTPHRAGPIGKVYIAWNNTFETVDLETCSRCIRCDSLKTRRVDRDTQYVELHGLACDDCMRLVPDAPSQ